MTSRDEVIKAENLPVEILKPVRSRSQLPVDLSRPLTDQLAELTAAFEERYLRRALKKTRGHVGRTARLYRPLAPDDHRQDRPLRDRQDRVQDRIGLARFGAVLALVFLPVVRVRPSSFGSPLTGVIVGESSRSPTGSVALC